MKKSVVILIAVIYVAAIALVSFFGINPELLEETIYVSNIELVNKDIKTSPAGAKYVTLYTDGDGYAEYQLDWRVTPTEATNTKVNFSYDDKDGTVDFVSVDENGLVKFTKAGVVTITVTPADGSILKTPAVLKVIAIQKQ